MMSIALAALATAKTMTSTEFENTIAKTHRIVNDWSRSTDYLCPGMIIPDIFIGKEHMKLDEMAGYFRKCPNSYDYLCNDELSICLKNNKRCIMSDNDPHSELSYSGPWNAIKINRMYEKCMDSARGIKVAFI